MEWTIKEDYNELAKSVTCDVKIEVKVTDDELLQKFNNQALSEKLDELQKIVHLRAVSQFNKAREVSHSESLRKA